MLTIRTLLIFICTTAYATAEQTPSEFMTSWVDAYNKNDANTIIACYDQSGSTYLECDGMEVRGFKEIEKMYREGMKACRFYDSKAEGMKHKLVEDEAEDLACVTFTHKFKYLIHETGDHYRIHIRTTALLRKNNDSWKIVCERSTPIHGIERAKIIQREQAGADQPATAPGSKPDDNDKPQPESEDRPK